METIQTNNLSFYNEQGILTLNAKQYDTGRKFIFYILDNDAPFDLTGCSVYLRMLKADGTQFQGEECCIIDNNTVTIDTSVSNGNQILTAEGDNQCELHLTDKDGKILTTWEFIIHVQKRVHNGDNIVSTDSWDLMDYIENTAKDFNEKLDNHYFVLTMDKDTAGGVPSLDADGKVPLDELYEATTTDKGITQLTDSITSTSTTTAATPNSIKMAYDKLEKLKAPLESPDLTGTPTAPTASVGTNTSQLATTAFVQTAVSNGIAASDAMIIKGTIGAAGTVTALPTTYKTGWTYRVVSAGTYAGQVCEIGDLIIALTDREGSDNEDSDWCVAQTNINGAITGVKSGDAFIQTSQSGSVVTITHKDVARSNTTTTATPSYGGTFTAIDDITSDTKGHVTKVNTKTVTLPTYTHPTTAGNKHIPNGGSSGQILKWSADGTAVWGDASFNEVVITPTTALKGVDLPSVKGLNISVEGETADDTGSIELTIDTVTSSIYSEGLGGFGPIDLGNSNHRWHTIYADNLNGTSQYAGYAHALTGFSGRNDKIGWGTLTSQNGYTALTTLEETGGGSIGFAAQNGQTSMQVDGKFYQNEGRYEVIDTNSISNYTAGSATKDGNGNIITNTYLPLAGGTITGNLRLKGSGNYGNKLNFGDGNYAYIYEPEDDVLEIKGQSGIRFISDEEILFNGKTLETMIKEYGRGSDIYAYTYNHGLSASNPVTYDCIQYNNGIMIYSIQVVMNISKTINLPISFIGDASVVMNNHNAVNFLNTKAFTCCGNVLTSHGISTTGFVFLYGTSNRFTICGSGGIYSESEYPIQLMAMGRWK